MLGDLSAGSGLLFIVEDYLSGLTLRLALDQAWPVAVVHERENFAWATERLRQVAPRTHFVLVSANDGAQQPNHAGSAPAWLRDIAQVTKNCSLTRPIFRSGTQTSEQTFNHLHVVEDLPAVRRQLQDILSAVLCRRISR